MQSSYYDFATPFTKEELDKVIATYDKELPPLRTLGEHKDDYRTGQGTWIRHKNDPIIERLKLLVGGVTGLPVENQESPHFIKYSVGGHYKHHFDYFQPNTDYYDEHIKRGGQRVFSSILYLNDNFEGGETDFPKHNLVVKPVTGKLFTWRNMTVDGQLDPNSNHAGLDVKSGIKYIVIIWTRQQKFV